MANRNFNRMQALEKEVKTLYAKCVITSSQPVLQQGLGVKSVTRNGIGTYVIQLEDKYSALMSVNVGLVSSSTALPQRVQYRSESVAADGKINFATINSADSFSSLADDVILWIRVDVKNSSVR